MHRVLAANAVRVHLINEMFTSSNLHPGYSDSAVTHQKVPIRVENKRFDLFLVQYRFAFDITHVQQEEQEQEQEETIDDRFACCNIQTFCIKTCRRIQATKAVVVKKREGKITEFTALLVTLCTGGNKYRI